MKKDSLSGLELERPAWAFANAWKAVAAFAALAFLMFADTLIAPGTRVLGNQGTDMFMQFVSWREFGFGQMSHGNLPLWNPHIYGGAPYFGGAQGALLYPVNWLSFFLPVVAAINWSYAINVWLMGCFMYAWAGFRGWKPLACFVAGALLMFCGPHFLHVYSGHPVHMAVMTWAPLVFLALDGALGMEGRFASRRFLGWCLLGMLAVAMQIFGGHPQYLFYTGITAALYTLLSAAVAAHDSRRAHRGGRTFWGCLAIPACAMGVIYTGGVALGAIQLLPAIQANGETLRSIPVPFSFASMFGFPPENILTLLNPYFFGDMQGVPYWGRCYLWEMSLFIGVTGLLVAVYGIAAAPRRARLAVQRKGILFAVAVVTFFLALGVHTPLFRLLYDWAPGFGKFRGVSKFTFQTILFVGMLAGAGFDALLRDPKPARRWAVGAAVAGGCVLLAAGFIAGFLTAEDWRGWMQAVLATKESYLPPAAFNDLGFAANAQAFAAAALVLPGVLLLAAGGLLWLAPNWRPALWILAALAVAEPFGFSLHTRETFDVRTIAPDALRGFIKDHPGDYRTLNLLPSGPNSAMSLGTFDMWGADPGAVRRYAEFMTWTQGGNPDDATQYVPFGKIDPLYAMLRFKYGFQLSNQRGIGIFESPAEPMAHVQIVPGCRVVTGGRDAIFQAMRAKDFDPRKEVILETPPSIVPDASATGGSARITASSTDWLEIEADTPAPAFLLVTDAYTPAWRAVALPGSAQQQYDVLPANYVLRAVPLAAGHHHLRMEYAPPAFTQGMRISLVAWILFLGAVVGWRWGR
ncbi:MAG: hypothetical protein PHQ12_12645 [Chthoniobacteraceae bacterium]|nr:hypothetical protein [Chthoniobacteraceae bacterium]